MWLMSRPSLVVIALLGLLLFLSGVVMILRFIFGVPFLSDPVLMERQQAIYSSGGMWLFYLYYIAIGSGAVLVCTSLTALSFRGRS
jgi:hypothetical protein